jgi:hypothetical protein
VNRKLPTLAAIVLLMLSTSSVFANPGLTDNPDFLSTLLAQGQEHAPQKIGKQAAQAPPGSFEAKVEGLLRQSGYEFQKVKSNSWFAIVQGREMSQMRIILGAGPASIAMGVVVVPKRNLRLDTDALVKLLKLSYELNYVGVVIDSDDDLLVMSQRKEAWLTPEELKATLSQVTAAADRAYAVMKPFIAQ